MRRWVGSLLALVAGTGLIATLPTPALGTPEPTEGAAGPSATVTERLRIDDGGFTDAQGRTVLLHGVNNVDKTAPFVEPGDGFTVTAEDAALLARHGFNTVRLGVSFDGIMPRRGEIDQDYLDRVASVIDVLGEQGIHVLLDNHQDGLGPPWGGNGFPAWAVNPKPSPLEPNPGFPLYYLMPSMSTAWTNVWSNTDGVLDDLGDALAALGSRVADQPAAMGIELLNEPWPGLAWPTCVPGGCPAFDRQYQQVHETLTERIRQVAPDLPVLWEPNVTFNFTMPSHLGEPPLTPPIRSRDVALSFHDYCEASQSAIYLGLPEELRGLCPVQHDITWSNADAVTDRTGMPALVTEFGDGDPEVLGNTLTRADERFTGWQYWHYESSFGADPSPDPFLGPEGRQLVRTYPRATAGTPESLEFDPDSGEFDYRYRPAPGSAPTEIYVSDLHYPRGYRVAVTGGTVTSAPGASVVTVRSDGTGPVRVRITGR